MSPQAPGELHSWALSWTVLCLHSCSATKPPKTQHAPLSPPNRTFLQENRCPVGTPINSFAVYIMKRPRPEQLQEFSIETTLSLPALEAAILCWGTSTGAKTTRQQARRVISWHLWPSGSSRRSPCRNRPIDAINKCMRQVRQRQIERDNASVTGTLKVGQPSEKPHRNSAEENSQIHRFQGSNRVCHFFDNDHQPCKARLDVHRLKNPQIKLELQRSQLMTSSLTSSLKDAWKSRRTVPPL